MADELRRFEHGGDIYAHVGAIDYSANINPLGMPPQAVQALCERIASFEAYPDAQCRELRRALSACEGVPTSHIVCTAGASDLIVRVCAVLRPAVGLVTAPCFSGYEEALERAGARVERIVLSEADDFAFTSQVADEFVARLAQESAGTRVLFLCNPNNPTGLCVDRSLLVRVLDAAREAGVVVVLDECFLDFTSEPSAVTFCDDYPNMLVMRAFTKLYAMAGLRLGYGLSGDDGLIERLQQAGQLWAVSTPAQVAGIAALSEPEWKERTRVYVDRERAVLAAGLRQCGMRVVDSAANYLLFQSPCPLYDELLRRGFLIRRCGNYEQLDDTWYRIAVRTAEENAALLAALHAVTGRTDERQVEGEGL